MIKEVSMNVVKNDFNLFINRMDLSSFPRDEYKKNGIGNRRPVSILHSRETRNLIVRSLSRISVRIKKQVKRNASLCWKVKERSLNIGM